MAAMTAVVKQEDVKEGGEEERYRHRESSPTLHSHLNNELAYLLTSSLSRLWLVLGLGTEGEWEDVQNRQSEDEVREMLDDLRDFVRHVIQSMNVFNVLTPLFKSTRLTKAGQRRSC